MTVAARRGGGDDRHCRRLLSLSPSLTYLSQMDVPHFLLSVAAAAMRPLRSKCAASKMALFALRLVGWSSQIHRIGFLAQKTLLHILINISNPCTYKARLKGFDQVW